MSPFDCVFIWTKMDYSLNYDNYILILILVSFGINSRHLDNPTAKLAIRAFLDGTAMATLLFGLVKKIITL